MNGAWQPAMRMQCDWDLLKPVKSHRFLPFLNPNGGGQNPQAPQPEPLGCNDWKCEISAVLARQEVETDCAIGCNFISSYLFCTFEPRETSCVRCHFYSGTSFLTRLKAAVARMFEVIIDLHFMMIKVSNL